jgi:hypothetical protein
MKKKTIYLLILLGVLLLAVALLLYFLGPTGKRWGNQLSDEGLSSTKEEKDIAGEVGEVLVANPETGEEESLKTATMPPAIFSVAGTISQLYDNGFAMMTDGYNFADEQGREVEVLYQTKTVTTLADRSSRYKGMDGLASLKVGQSVVVESDENIRGKLKFKANYINLLP